MKEGRKWINEGRKERRKWRSEGRKVRSKEVEE